jgi:hypothetical protein
MRLQCLNGFNAANATIAKASDDEFWILFPVLVERQHHGLQNCCDASIDKMRTPKPSCLELPLLSLMFMPGYLSVSNGTTDLHHE